MTITGPNVVEIEVFPDDTANLAEGLYDHDAAVEINNDAEDRRDVMDGQLQIVERVAAFA